MVVDVEIFVVVDVVVLAIVLVVLVVVCCRCCRSGCGLCVTTRAGIVAVVAAASAVRKSNCRQLCAHHHKTKIPERYSTVEHSHNILAAHALYRGKCFLKQG